MSDISNLFQGADLDVGTIHLLTLAYEKARKSLHDRGQPSIVREVIAARMIEAARSGERNPDKLCETALMALGNKAVFER
jgi:hypothetical protein